MPVPEPMVVAFPSRLKGQMGWWLPVPGSLIGLRGFEKDWRSRFGNDGSVSGRPLLAGREGDEDGL